jgi:heparin/heparan-sulfate lyase
MICQTLLPRDAVLSAAGGPGKEFWAAGKNWSIVSRGLEPENQAMMGQWRVEVSPATARKDDVFLHVIQVGDPSSTTRSTAEPVDANQHPGARVQVGGQIWEVTFDTAGDLGGHIRRTGEGRTIDAPLPTTVQPQSGSGTQR